MGLWNYDGELLLPPVRSYECGFLAYALARFVDCLYSSSCGLVGFVNHDISLVLQIPVPLCLFRTR